MAFSASDPNCVLAFEFEDNATDLSGNGHTGTLNNGATYADGEISNRWLSLDGADDYVAIADHADLDSMTELTISAWIKPNTTDSNNVLISKRDDWSGTGIPYEINITDGTSVSFRVIGNNPLNTSSAIFTTNTLHLVTCTWDGTTAKIYVDGVEQASGTRSGTLTANSRDVTIGHLPAGGEYYGGFVDRLFIFSEAKSSTDIGAEFLYGIELEQEGFRFRNDDGSETTATWLAAQDTSITRETHINTRLRVLVDAIGNPASFAYALYYKLSSDSEWTEVPDAEDYYSGELTTGGTASASAENQPGEGSDEAFDGSADTKWLAFATTPTLQYRFGSSATHIVTKYAITSGNDDDTRDPKDWTLQGSNDGSSWTTVDTVTGETFASRKLRKEFICDTPGSTAYEYYRLNISANNGGGITQLSELELYETIQSPVFLSASANITASGEVTTAQLTAPSGKTTSDFVSGRIQDDENPADTVDITTDDYTELEWCIQTGGPASNGQVYQFRIFAGVVPLATYTVTPQWTIGTAGAGVVFVGFKKRRGVGY